MAWFKAVALAMQDFGLKKGLGYVFLVSAVPGILYAIWIACEHEMDGKKLSKKEAVKNAISYAVVSVGLGIAGWFMTH